MYVCSLFKKKRGDYKRRELFKGINLQAMTTTVSDAGVVGSSRGSVVVVTETESRLESLSGSIDGTLAIFVSGEEGNIVFDGALEISASRDEILESHGFVSY